MFVVMSLMKLKKIGESSRQGQSEEKMTGVIIYFLMGASLIFMPSILPMLSNSAFGNGNILQYIPYNPYNVINSMEIVLQMAGLIWFLRGCALVVQGSKPGAKEGKKGLTFIAAGILAMNLQASFGIITYLLDKLMSLTKP